MGAVENALSAFSKELAGSFWASAAPVASTGLLLPWRGLQAEK